MHPRNLRIEDYTYRLPDEKIAAQPLPERDASKLLIYEGGNITEDTYRNIAQHIPAGTTMVFNRTKVVHARLLFQKPTGGVIEVFCLEPHSQYPDVQTAMTQTRKVWWNCLVGGASKWKHGMVLTMQHSAHDFILSASVMERGPGSFTIELSWNNDMSFAEMLFHAGKVPLPPYIHREVKPEDEARYQTVFARDAGSVAAPTAGLHFTDTVLQSLREKGVDTDFVTLHVGAGTFIPVKADTMQGHDMHAEWIEADVNLVQKLSEKVEHGVVAVGTTSLRTIESLYWIGAKILQHTVPDFNGIAVSQWDPYDMKADVSAKHALKALADWMLQHHVPKLVTRTQILIAPGYDFKVANGLVTNFHQPGSTLLLLVAALVGDEWKRIYDYALQHDFRFLSYGDGCLLWK